jgi:hypothetical protein
MVDIESPAWRAKHGVTLDDAERRLDAAFEIEGARLVGELIPGGKDRVPLQAADVLCWYTNAQGPER